MKINDIYSNRNDINYMNKVDFSNNDSFGLPLQSKNSKPLKEQNNIYNEPKIDPRLELTLNYLDITSTIPTFITNNISFNDLLLLSKNDLVELGFLLVERNRILKFSQEFKKFGKRYNLKEINKFFNEYQNLNMRLLSNNNNSKPIQQEKTEKNNNSNTNCNNNSKYNYINNNFHITNNSNALYLEEGSLPIYNSNYNNNYIYPKSNNFSNSNNNYSNNNFINDYQITSKIGNQNKEMNIDNNQDNNYSSKLIRQNSKTSKNSSYSKSSKSRLVTVSKNYTTGPPSSSGGIIQKFQNLNEEIDNYFKRYNNYKEQRKNTLKKYQLIKISNNRNNNNLNKTNEKKKNSSNNNVIKNKFNENENNVEEKNKNNKINEEIEQKLQKLKELHKRKKELKEKLNTVCDNENKKKMIIKYLEEEERGKDQ